MYRSTFMEDGKYILILYILHSYLHRFNYKIQPFQQNKYIYISRNYDAGTWSSVISLDFLKYPLLM
jgi:predicted metalloprotease with PDZ domain